MKPNRGQCHLRSNLHNYSITKPTLYYYKGFFVLSYIKAGSFLTTNVYKKGFLHLPFLLLRARPQCTKEHMCLIYMLVCVDGALDGHDDNKIYNLKINLEESIANFKFNKFWMQWTKYLNTIYALCA